MRTERRPERRGGGRSVLDGGGREGMALTCWCCASVCVCVYKWVRERVIWRRRRPTYVTACCHWGSDALCMWDCVCVPLWSVCVNCSVFWGWIWHIYSVLCYFDLGPLTSFIVVLSTALSLSGKRCWKNCRTVLHSHFQTESRPSSILLLIRHFNFPLWVRIESCESWDGWLILSRSPKRVSHVN